MIEVYLGSGSRGRHSVGVSRVRHANKISLSVVDGITSRYIDWLVGGLIGLFVGACSVGCRSVGSKIGTGVLGSVGIV